MPVSISSAPHPLMFWLDMANAVTTSLLVPRDASHGVDSLPATSEDVSRSRSRSGRAAATGTFHDGSGAEGAYKLFLPDHSRKNLPLVVMLHGCSQDPRDFASGTMMNEAALAAGFAVLYPAQSSSANSQKCWNWFHPGHQQRGIGEPAMLAAMTRSVIASHSIDPRRVYVAGLSAGGAMATILGTAYPEIFAAIGVHSGLAANSAQDISTALALMRGEPSADTAGTQLALPTIVFHGDADGTVHVSNGERLVEACARSATKAEQDRSHVNGRDCTRSIHRRPDGEVVAEHWVLHGGDHAWSGGSALGSYSDQRGPNASAEMLRFFNEHPRLQRRSNPGRRNRPGAKAFQSQGKAS